MNDLVVLYIILAASVSAFAKPRGDMTNERKMHLREIALTRSWSRDAEVEDAILELLSALETAEDALRFGEEVCAALIKERDDARAEVRRLRECLP